MRNESRRYAIRIPSISRLRKVASAAAARSIKVTTRTSSIKKSKSKPERRKLEKFIHGSLNITGISVSRTPGWKPNHLAKDPRSRTYCFGSRRTRSIYVYIVRFMNFPGSSRRSIRKPAGNARSRVSAYCTELNLLVFVFITFEIS